MDIRSAGNHLTDRQGLSRLSGICVPELRTQTVANPPISVVRRGRREGQLLAESRMAALKMPPAEADICILPSADNCPPLAVAQNPHSEHMQSLTCLALSSDVQASRLPFFGGRRLLKRQSDSRRGIRVQ